MGLYLEYTPLVRKRQPHRQIVQEIRSDMSPERISKLPYKHIGIDIEEMPIKTTRRQPLPVSRRMANINKTDNTKQMLMIIWSKRNLKEGV